MRFQVLGPVQATVGDSVVELTGAKERALLARLILAAGTTVSSDELVDSLWGDDPPRTAAKSLQTYVLRLRNTLEPGRRGSSAVLTTEGSGYRLVTATDSIDAHTFARLADRGRAALAAGRPAEAAATLREALALWRGPAYGGVDALAVRAAARRLEELRAAALEDRLAADLDLGHSVMVAAELEQVVGEHPYRERAWALLVTALYRSGRQGDALAAYARCRQVLVEEVGVEPGAELKALQARVLAQDPGLLGTAARRPVPAGLSLPGGPLVGRDSELATLRDFWDDRSDETRLLVVRGPAGAGATRLAAELADHVVTSGGTVAFGEPAPAGGLAVYDDPGVPLSQPTSWRTLVLARPDHPVVPGAGTLDLRPLPPVAVRELVSTYVTAADTDEATAQVLRESGGWPGAVHAEALAWVRRKAAAVVQSAAARTGASSAALASAREELSDGILTLQGAGAHAAASTSARCPWPGLAPYGSADAALFAGRERLVAEIVARAASSSLVALVGSSGSGKSSVVRAGLLPGLTAGVLPASATWRQLVMRPGEHPMSELARVALGPSGASEAEESLGALLERGLRGAAAHEQVVLVVDQFEEVWTACTDPGERRLFLDTLAELAAGRAVLAVPVIRSDFLGDLADHAALATLVGDCTVLVGTPHEAEVRRAVALPAQRCGLELETGLVDAVVEDAGREPGVLPLLSTAMTQLWHRREGRTLTLRSYVADGGLSGAIARLAEGLYASLTPTEQAAARAVLLRLAGPGEGEGVVRRRTPLSELVGLEAPGVTDAVEKLAAARLVTISHGHAEVAHEALFREWPRLRDWLADDVTTRDLLRRLAVDAAEWDTHGRDDTALWRGPKLLAGVDVAATRSPELTAREREFLATAQARMQAEQHAVQQRAEAAARQNRRLRRLLGGLAGLLVLALLAGLTAWRAQHDAAAARASADARRLAATALTEDYLDLALLSAVEAVKAERSPETTGALLTLLARLPDVLTQVRSQNRFLGGAMSPDRRTMLLWENEPVLQAVDSSSGTVRWTSDLPGQVASAAVSPDGSQVAAAVFTAPSPTVLLLDATDGRQRARLSATDIDGLLPQVAWLDAGRLVVLTTSGVVVVDPDLHASEPVSWQKQPVSEGANLRALGPGRLVVSGAGQPVTVVDVGRGSTRTVAGTGDVFAAVPDGTIAAVTTPPAGPEESGTSLTLVDTATWKPVSRRVPLNGLQAGLAFSADGSTLAVGTANDSGADVVQLRDGRTGALQRELTGHNGSVMGVGFTGGADDLLWSVGRDGSAYQWDLSRQRGVVRSSASEVETHLADVSRDGRVAVALTERETTANEAYLFDPRTGQRLRDAPLPMPDCACQPWPVVLTPDGTVAVGGLEELSDPHDRSGPRTGRLVLWDVPGGTLRDEMPLPWVPTGLGLSGDGRRVVVNGTGGWALVDLASARVVATSPDAPMDVLEVPDSVAVAPGGRVAAVGRTAEVVLVSTTSGRELRRTSLPDGDGMLTGTWPDPGTLVVGGWRGMLHVLRASDLTDVVPPRLVAAGWITDLTTSPDGRLTASADTDGKLRLYDTRTWRPLGKAVLQRPGWGWLAFAGDRTLRGYFDGGGRVELTMQSAAWIRAACRLAARELTRDEWADVHPGRPWRPTCRSA